MLTDRRPAASQAAQRTPWQVKPHSLKAGQPPVGATAAAGRQQNRRPVPPAEDHPAASIKPASRWPGHLEADNLRHPAVRESSASLCAACCRVRHHHLDQRQAKAVGVPAAAMTPRLRKMERRPVARRLLHRAMAKNLRLPDRQIPNPRHLPAHRRALPANQPPPRVRDLLLPNHRVRTFPTTVLKGQTRLAARIRATASRPVAAQRA